MAKERMYVHPKFKKMMKMATIETNSKDVLSFTKKVVEEPEILTRYKNKKNNRRVTKHSDSFF